MTICPSGYTTHAPVIAGTVDCVPVTSPSGDVTNGQGVGMGLGLGVAALAAVSAMFLFVTFGPAPHETRRNPSVPKKDKESFDYILDSIRMQRNWHPGSRYIDLESVSSRVPGGKKVTYAIARRYPNEIAEAIGAKAGAYRKAEYTSSGRGAFGRLGGGGKSHYSHPFLVLEF